MVRRLVEDGKDAAAVLREHRHANQIVFDHFYVESGRYDVSVILPGNRVVFVERKAPVRKIHGAVRECDITRILAGDDVDRPSSAPSRTRRLSTASGAERTSR